MLTLPMEVSEALASGRFSVRHMLRVDFEGGAEGIWNGDYSVEVEGVTYAPLAGNMIADEVPSSDKLDADRLEVRLAGLIPAAAQMLEGVEWHQRPAVFSIAFLNDAGAIIHVLPRFSGFLDAAPTSDAVDDMLVIALQIESNNRGLYRNSQRVRSDSDQRSVSGSDGFFKYATAVATDPNIVWGRKGEQYPVRPK